MPRFHIPLALAIHSTLTLPDAAARHAQVLRLQPGAAITLFNGTGGEWQATILHMGRSAVSVEITDYRASEREARRAVHLGFGLMAAERMEWLLEKATELGAAQLTPISAARSTLRLSAERARAKHARWQAVAAAACEQCGRNRLPEVALPSALDAWLAARTEPARWLLTFSADAQTLPAARVALPPDAAIAVLSGPEGGLAPEEETAARGAGFRPVTLGARVLRAETAPLAALTALTLE